MCLAATSNLCIAACLVCALRVHAGPSQEARDKAIKKRQRKAFGLSGRAAELKRKAALTARGVDEQEAETSARAMASSGIYYSNGAAGELAPLPNGYSLETYDGTTARDALSAYHTLLCNHAPADVAGREAALAEGWAAPQQRVALDGGIGDQHCNLVVVARNSSGHRIGMIALSLAPDARRCSVLAIHVRDFARGTRRIPEHLWKAAKAAVDAEASGRKRPPARVRFSLELACCQSQQGAHFWINRMGWDGTEQARRAAQQWSSGVKSEVGEYVLWFDLDRACEHK